MDDTTTNAPAAPVADAPLLAPELTAPQAREHRSMFLADAAWRERAMNPASREYRTLQALDLRIAGLGTEPPQEPTPQRVLRETVTHGPPPDGRDYELPEHALQLTDAAGLQAWKDGMRAAGVDNDLAAVAWQVTSWHAERELDPAEVSRQAATAESQLRMQWGVEKFDERLAAANEEGKRLFAKLPASLVDGMDYRTFMLTTGLANSVTFARMLYERAAERLRYR